MCKPVASQARAYRSRFPSRNVCEHCCETHVACSPGSGPSNKTSIAGTNRCWRACCPLIDKPLKRSDKIPLHLDSAVGKSISDATSGSTISPASVRQSRITTVAMGETPGQEASSLPLMSTRTGAGLTVLNSCCSNHFSTRANMSCGRICFLSARSGRLILLGLASFRTIYTHLRVTSNRGC